MQGRTNLKNCCKIVQNCKSASECGGVHVTISYLNWLKTTHSAVRRYLVFTEKCLQIELWIEKIEYVHCTRFWFVFSLLVYMVFVINSISFNEAFFCLLGNNKSIKVNEMVCMQLKNQEDFCVVVPICRPFVCGSDIKAYVQPQNVNFVKFHNKNYGMPNANALSLGLTFI